MKNKSIRYNFLYSTAYQILNVLTSFVTAPYLSRVLGAEAIGIQSYTQSIQQYFLMFAALGTFSYGSREISMNRDDPYKRSKLFWEIELIVVATTSMAVLSSLALLWSKYRIYYIVLSIGIFASMFDISWFFQGKEEFKKLVTRNTIVKLLCLILIFTCVHSESDLWKYFLIYVSADVIGNLVTWLYLPKYLVKINKKDLKLKKHIIPMLILFLPQVAIQIYTVLDKTMIGVITKNMSDVGYYEQAQKITKAALSIITSLQVVMNSRIAALYASKNDLEIKENMEKSFKFTWLLGIPLSLGIIAISHGLVSWYYGPGYEPVEMILMVISPIILAIGFSSVIGVQYLVQVGKTKEFTKSIIFGCITNFILNIILIRHLSSTGAAIASVIAEALVFIIQLFYLKHDYSDLKILKGSCMPIIAGICMLIVVKYIDLNFDVSILMTILEIIIGAIVYLGILIMFKYKFLIDIINQVYVAFCKLIKKEK